MTPHPERLAYVQYALRQGHTVKQVAKMTSMDPWFLYQLKEINDQQLELEKHPMESIPDRGAARVEAHGILRRAAGRQSGGWMGRRKSATCARNTA